MTVPLWLGAILNILNDAFVGTIKWSFFVVAVLFAARLLFDLIIDTFLHNIKRYFHIIFLPGAFFHQLWHSLVIKLLGYQIKVNFHMSFALRDIPSQSLQGELRNPFHAFLIGTAPLLNFGLFALLKFLQNYFNNFFNGTNFPIGKYFMIYLLVSLLFFGLPDINDLLLPFYSATAYQSELIFLLMMGFIGFVVAIAYWGWFIPLINFLLYCIALIYLAEQHYFKKRVQSVVKDAFEEKN
ncbi:MAG: hypothetical protein ACTSYD_02715 [Candidatus Heimdallarchaeaceae archaeon]